MGHFRHAPLSTFCSHREEKRFFSPSNLSLLSDYEDNHFIGSPSLVRKFASEIEIFGSNSIVEGVRSESAEDRTDRSNALAKRAAHQLDFTCCKEKEDGHFFLGCGFSLVLFSEP